MSNKYQGKGFVQLTGRNSMPNITSNTSSINLGNLQPLTLNQINSSSSFGFSAHPTQSYSATFDFESLMPGNKNLKKYEVFESTESIITLSVAKHRLKTTEDRWYKLTDTELYNRITHEDRQQADAIKDYYSKKIMMIKLKGDGKLSRFREDLNQLVHSDGLMFKENVLGLAYSLPYFYQYDLELDDVMGHLTKNQGFDALDKKGTPTVMKLSATLSPIKRITRTTKQNKKMQYWFNDDKLNAGVLIDLLEKNPLQNLWDYEFNKKEVLKIEGNYARRKLDDFEYFHVTNWNIVRD